MLEDVIPGYFSLAFNTARVITSFKQDVESRHSVNYVAFRTPHQKDGIWLNSTTTVGQLILEQ